MAAVVGVALGVRPLPGEDLAELDRSARLLAAELAELDVESVGPLPAARAPEHAKGLGSWMGWLLVELPSQAASLTALFAAVAAWTARTHRTVELTLDGETLKVEGATPAQLDQLIHAFLARHSTR
ncbi:hypothetical protein AB0B50_00365 [Streptomyces sp. NPDC041068]|uniref:hypothetical protein n=1 Tax=Streptomyces sp. NPDC041068 TaxID=3155130 RepID=UPI003401F8C3